MLEWMTEYYKNAISSSRLFELVLKKTRINLVSGENTKLCLRAFLYKDDSNFFLSNDFL